MNAKPWRAPLVGRDRDERHRSATPLELFYDLCFVVAVASAAERLHHGLAEGHWNNLLGFALVFFAIWWAWMNFTWFASAYDTDDILYRLLTFVQMSGALVLAAGVPAAFDTGDLRVAVVGYGIMRVPMIAQWLRAAHDHPDIASTARRYAAGIAFVQVLWVARLAVPGPPGLVLVAVLVLGELAVPVVAERSGQTPWHPRHITERYGLFLLIVLGEVMLSSTTAIQGGVSERGLTLSLLLGVVGGLLIVFCMWWFYFKHSAEPSLEDMAGDEARSPFLWGYSHYLIYAAAAATGSGLGAVVDVVQSQAHVGTRAAALTVALPVSVYLVTVGALQSHDDGSRRMVVRGTLTAVAVLAVALLGIDAGLAVLLIGLVLTGALAHHLVADHDPEATRRHRADAASGKVAGPTHG